MKSYNNATSQSFFHALGVVVYVGFVACLMLNGEAIFGKMSEYTGPMAFLLLFIISAIITSGLVFAKPILMYLNGKKKEAIYFLSSTIAWLMAITVLVFAAAIFIR